MRLVAIVVTGDRHAKEADWYQTMEAAIVDEWCRGSPHGVLIHGAATGVDTIAGKIGSSFGDAVLPMPAPWDQRGKSAGPFRNTRMLGILAALRDVGYTVQVLAFHNDIDTSKGTKHCVFAARTMGLPVRVIKSDGTIVASFNEDTQP